MKIKISIVITIVCTILSITIFSVMAEKSEMEKCYDFLKKFGWDINQKYISRDEVWIPDNFDRVYEGYEVIQNDAGLSLKQYCGKKGARYTFEVENYPIDVGETVYANVICIDGEPVGGDVMTVSLNGFMHSLNFPK